MIAAGWFLFITEVGCSTPLHKDARILSLQDLDAGLLRAQETETTSNYVHGFQFGWWRKCRILSHHSRISGIYLATLHNYWRWLGCISNQSDEGKILSIKLHLPSKPGTRLVHLLIDFRSQYYNKYTYNPWDCESAHVLYIRWQCDTDLNVHWNMRSLCYGNVYLYSIARPIHRPSDIQSARPE